MRKSNHHQTLAVLLALIASASGGCGDAETGAGGATTTASASGGMGSGGGATTGTGGAGGSGGATTGTGGAGGGGGGSGGSTGTFMGAPCAGDKCDVTLNGLDFTPDNGLMVHAGIVPQGSNKGFIWEDAATVANGTFTVQGVAVLTKGVGYFLNFYVDKNQNGACDSTPTDNVYRISISPVQGHVVADVTRDKNLSNIGCGGF